MLERPSEGGHDCIDELHFLLGIPAENLDYLVEHVGIIRHSDSLELAEHAVHNTE